MCDPKIKGPVTRQTPRRVIPSNRSSVWLPVRVQVNCVTSSVSGSMPILWPTCKWKTRPSHFFDRTDAAIREVEDEAPVPDRLQLEMREESGDERVCVVLVGDCHGLRLPA